MTTVITDGTRVLSDSQVSKGNERLPYSCTKVVQDDYKLFCFSGSIANFPPLMSWYNSGAHPSDRPVIIDEDQHTLWVFDPDKGPQRFFNVQKFPYPEPLGFPAAMGSGGDYALGAIFAGATLEEAMEAACALDVYTGGEIKVTTIPEKPVVERKPGVLECFMAKLGL